MHQIIFYILEDQTQFRAIINRLIIKLSGEFVLKETREGGVYKVSFDREKSAQEFRTVLKCIIPNAVM